MFRLHDGAPSAPADKAARAADLRAAVAAHADRLKATHGTDDIEAALRAEGERALSEGVLEAQRERAQWRAEQAQRARQQQDDMRVLAEQARQARTEGEAKAQKAPKPKPAPMLERDKRLPAGMDALFRRIKLRTRIEAGAQAAGKPFVLGTDCCAADLARALVKMGEVPADQNMKTLAEAIRAHYDEIKWRARKALDGTVDKIVEFYRMGEAQEREKAQAARQAGIKAA